MSAVEEFLKKNKAYINDDMDHQGMHKESMKGHFSGHHVYPIKIDYYYGKDSLTQDYPFLNFKNKTVDHIIEVPDSILFSK